MHVGLQGQGLLMSNIVWFSGQCDKTLHGLYPSTSAEPYPQGKYIKAMPHLCAAAARMTELLPLEGATSKMWEHFGFPARDIEPAKKKNSVVSCKLRESAGLIPRLGQSEDETA